MIPSVEEWAYNLLKYKYKDDTRVIGVFRDLIEEQDVDLQAFNTNPSGVTILVEANVEKSVYIARKHRFDHVKVLMSARGFDSVVANEIIREITDLYAKYGFTSLKRVERKDIDELNRGTGTSQVFSDYENFRFNGIDYLK